MRKLFMVLVVPALLAAAFAWTYWLGTPRPWELWERTSTPEEVDAWDAGYKRCGEPYWDKVMKAPTEKKRLDISALEAEKAACLATVPRLPWKQLSSYARKDECEQARIRDATDHPRAGHIYQCRYNEEKDR